MDTGAWRLGATAIGGCSLAVTAVSLAASAVTHSSLLLVVGHSSLLLAPLSLSLSPHHMLSEAVAGIAGGN